MGVVKKSVAINEVLDKFVRATWAKLIEAGYDVSYSTALNFMLLVAVLMVEKHGISDDVAETLVDFLKDRKTVEELEIADIENKINKIRDYISSLRKKKVTPSIYA